VADHPDYAEAYNSLGVAYMRLGRHDRARAAFRKVLELDPTSAKAYENLGADELAAGDLPTAILDLHRAVELDPLLYDALYNLGMALDSLGRRGEARHTSIASSTTRHPRATRPISPGFARGSRQKNRPGEFPHPASRSVARLKPSRSIRSASLSGERIYQIKRKPTRAVRGPRIAVGWR
jgi:tetratricopeptide (TPR) repeat protein